MQAQKQRSCPIASIHLIADKVVSRKRRHKERAGGNGPGPCHPDG
jgi:hypothetical protein